MPNYKIRNCELCKKEYVPTSPKQKYCIDCKEEGRRITARKRDRKRSRKKNSYTEYNRKCLACGMEFSTYYSKKLYCGADECEKYRLFIKNKRIHVRRDKDYLIEKGRRYYKENKELCCLKKAEKYREDNPDAKPYVPGRVYKHDVEYVRDYVSQFGYELLSEEYINNREKILLLCSEGHEWETSFHNFKDCNNRCATCYVQNNYTSSIEQKIRDYIEDNFKTINVVYNDRTIIGPKELDIFFPDHNLAIEICGLYWHSDTANGIARSYHYDKMMSCFEKDIRLITIFEDEINNKFDLVVSRIQQALGVSENVIYARNCEVKVIDNKTANNFFEDNHLQGRTQSKIAFGLFNNKMLVSACSIGKVTRNHVGSDNTLELKRFCNLSNTHIVGSASKLFKQVRLYAKDNNYKIIKSYCDMRYANIFKPVYELLGFKLNTETKYTPHYFKQGVRYRNMSLRKTPQERLTGKTEVELRVEQGYNRIWDCGHRTYEYYIN